MQERYLQTQETNYFMLVITNESVNKKKKELPTKTKSEA